MSEKIKIRVVVEEVVVDFEAEIASVYGHKDIEAFITKSIQGALELHAKRKESL